MGYSFVPFKGPPGQYSLNGGTVLFSGAIRRRNQLRNQNKIFEIMRSILDESTSSLGKLILPEKHGATISQSRGETRRTPSPHVTGVSWSFHLRRRRRHSAGLWNEVGKRFPQEFFSPENMRRAVRCSPRACHLTQFRQREIQLEHNIDRDSLEAILRVARLREVSGVIGTQPAVEANTLFSKWPSLK